MHSVKDTEYMTRNEVISMLEGMRRPSNGGNTSCISSDSPPNDPLKDLMHFIIYYSWGKFVGPTELTLILFAADVEGAVCTLGDESVTGTIYHKTHHGIAIDGFWESINRLKAAHAINTIIPTGGGTDRFISVRDKVPPTRDIKESALRYISHSMDKFYQNGHHANYLIGMPFLRPWKELAAGDHINIRDVRLEIYGGSASSKSIH